MDKLTAAEAIYLCDLGKFLLKVMRGHARGGEKKVSSQNFEEEVVAKHTVRTLVLAAELRDYMEIGEPMAKVAETIVRSEHLKQLSSGLFEGIRKIKHASLATHDVSEQVRKNVNKMMGWDEVDRGIFVHKVF